LVRQKRKSVIHDKRAGWIMTYADMMSLLLTFFVLIVSFSSMQQSKFQQAAQSLQTAFGVMPHNETAINFDNPIMPRQEYDSEDSEIYFEVRQMEAMIAEQGLDRDMEVEVQDNGVLFRIDAPFLFTSGESDLKSDSRQLLDRLVRFLEKFPHQVRVEGHTDAVPIHSSRYPSNWELSAARAVTVARYFQSLGMPPDRIAATGFGQYQPIADNSTENGRKMNRRVEIFLQMDKKGTSTSLDMPLDGSDQKTEDRPTEG
jgi:chemotaxis protein MotB